MTKPAISVQPNTRVKIHQGGTTPGRLVGKLGTVVRVDSQQQITVRLDQDGRQVWLLPNEVQPFPISL